MRTGTEGKIIFFPLSSLPFTFTARKGVVPLPVNSVLACQHRVADQHVSREAFKRYGLACVEIAVDDIPVVEWIWVLTVL